MDKKKIITIVSVVLMSVLLIYGGILANQVFSKNTKFSQKEFYVQVPTGSSYEDVKKILEPLVENMNRFEMVANKRSYPENVKPGRFLLTNGMNSYQLVKALRSNVPVKLAFNNQERLEDFAGRISSQIEPDSLLLINTFQDSTFLKENNFTSENVFVMFIPNTYEVYWNISAEKFRDKMIKEYHNFWNKERTEKAAKQSLTPVEATILASIVHKESVKKDERPRIAGVYLNRMKLEMPLQADPTVIFAKKLKDNDFKQTIKRVFYNDLFLNSPYNTYKVIGLPPGPIAMPDITALEAVLAPEKHDFIYFCASVDRFGYHEFAATLPEHNVNAKKYSDWINGQGVAR
ncbi:endolytic transglycosylase MltG [Flavobacterium nackdongense]|uniref:Endolytic murein transglycosylase n=1 Tax=Flavobacterium nackdongense TaxID=2547394 RepID=A0A4P6YD33_9FLAO|nr:endolytic transglycosylase MltG [Flavobacterium nackdongense]QBN18577.1 endolytic transglycosylase MltG [Flavobacterium nackdongense]